MINIEFIGAKKSVNSRDLYLKVNSMNKGIYLLIPEVDWNDKYHEFSVTAYGEANIKFYE